MFFLVRGSYYLILIKKNYILFSNFQTVKLLFDSKFSLKQIILIHKASTLKTKFGNQVIPAIPVKKELKEDLDLMEEMEYPESQD